LTPGDATAGRQPTPGRGLVVLNRASGRHHTNREQLQLLFPDHRVVDCEPEEITDVVRKALAEGATFLGVAGGDGSLRSCAEHLVGSDIPLLPVPAGTRNHFARQLGITDLEAAAKAVNGVVEAVDVGEVNGRYFINNSTLGLYPQMVELRERYRRRGVPKEIAQIAAAWHQVRHGHRFEVTVNGQLYRAWMVFIGNGGYGNDLFDIADRQSITGNVLDVRVVRADRFLARTRITLALVFGRLHRSPLLITQTQQEVDLDLGPGRQVEVALDGELEALQSPLHYRSRPTSLYVLIPPHQPRHRPRILGRAHRPDG
jgi:undecaprenyl-diphosphatase